MYKQVTISNHLCFLFFSTFIALGLPDLCPDSEGEPPMGKAWQAGEDDGR